MALSHKYQPLSIIFISLRSLFSQLYPSTGVIIARIRKRNCNRQFALYSLTITNQIKWEFVLKRYKNAPSKFRWKSVTKTKLELESVIIFLRKRLSDKLKFSSRLAIRLKEEIFLEKEQAKQHIISFDFHIPFCFLHVWLLPLVRCHCMSRLLTNELVGFFSLKWFSPHVKAIWHSFQVIKNLLDNIWWFPR